MSHGKPLWKALWEFPKTLNIYFPHLPYKLASHLVPKINLVTTQPGLHNETFSQKQKRERERKKKVYINTEDVHSNFIRVAKHWGRSKRSRTSQWTNKFLNIYSVENFLALWDDWPTDTATRWMVKHAGEGRRACGIPLTHYSLETANRMRSWRELGTERTGSDKAQASG